MKKRYKKMPQVALTIDVEQDAPPFLNTWQGVEKELPLIKRVINGPESDKLVCAHDICLLT
jgi:hypothetical protein